MAFKKGSNITCRIGKVNDAFDEKGNVAIYLREAAWKSEDGSEGHMGLEIRKCYINAEGKETPNKGVRFCTEEGPHRLASCLIENGYGHTQECIKALSTRKDFEESLCNVIGEVAVKKAKKSTPRVQYFDPRELASNG